MGYIQVLFQSENSSTFKIYTVGGSILEWLKERALLSESLDLVLLTTFY